MRVPVHKKACSAFRGFVTALGPPSWLGAAKHWSGKPASKRQLQEQLRRQIHSKQPQKQLCGQLRDSRFVNSSGPLFETTLKQLERDLFVPACRPRFVKLVAFGLHQKIQKSGGSGGGAAGHVRWKDPQRKEECQRGRWSCFYVVCLSPWCQRLLMPSLWHACFYFFRDTCRRRRARCRRRLFRPAPAVS